MGGKASAVGPEPGQFAEINEKHVTRRRPPPPPRLELNPWATPRTLALLSRPAGMKVSGRIPVLPSTHSANPDRAPTPAPDTTRGSEAEEAPGAAGLEDTYLLPRLKIRSALRRRGPRLSLPGDPPPPRPRALAARRSLLPSPPPSPGRRLRPRLPPSARAPAAVGCSRAGRGRWELGSCRRPPGARRSRGVGEGARGRGGGRARARVGTGGGRAGRVRGEAGEPWKQHARSPRRVGAPPGGLTQSSLATSPGLGAAPCGFQGPLPVVLYVRTRRPVAFCDVRPRGENTSFWPKSWHRVPLSLGVLPGRKGGLNFPRLRTPQDSVSPPFCPFIALLRSPSPLTLPPREILIPFYILYGCF